MLAVHVNEAEQLLTLAYSQQVRAEEMKGSMQSIKDALADLRPGFRLLTNITDLESMEIACATHIEETMELCDEKQVGEVVRVIPDPKKDIGFNIMSRFHYGPNVKLRTYDNLAEALQSLRLDGTSN